MDPTPPIPATPSSPRNDSIWQAPLFPVALAATAGIVLDRYSDVPLPFSLAAVVAGLIAWLATRGGKQAGLPLVYLAGAVLALGAAHHHWYREVYPDNDIGVFAAAGPGPVRVQGILIEEPILRKKQTTDPLRSFPPVDPTVSVMQVNGIKVEEDWLPVTGRARLVVNGRLESVHPGDQLEAVGVLSAPHGPANPGEFDQAAHLRDQRIRAQLTVRHTGAAVTPGAEGWQQSLAGWLAVIRGWGQQQLERGIRADQQGVATALLLGEGSGMTDVEWEKYTRTGVIHVLAISGQHLMVLAIFLWWVLRLAGVRRRRGAWFVALFLLSYALLTGGRPPVLRSAVAVCAACVGLVLRRPALTANSFALAWLVVAGINPTDIFNAGCQLSFLAVAILYWGTTRWWLRDADPLAEVIDESRPIWLRALRWLGRLVLFSYAVTLAIWLASAPLVAARYHLVSPVGILIGPPMILLSSIALIAGFLLLLASVVLWPVAAPFAWVTRQCLAGCDLLVRWSEGLPGGHWYVSDVPDWWLWVFYPCLLMVLFLEPLRTWRWTWPAGLGWLCVGLAAGLARPASDELRCTFLAVGHGGCTVLETPDGRTILYDAGAMAGPDVARWQIAPFLWSRGIRRIDEVILSHADLDHFNGLPALLERFAVGQVTCTPTFAEKPTRAVEFTMDSLRRQRIPVRTVWAGDRFAAGSVEMEVLHPPDTGPAGSENARSLVLLVRHAGHSILLTGDLEGPGMEAVLSLPWMPVDVLMAPHHGSRLSNTPRFAEWARPRVVISCEGPPRGPERPREPYSPRKAQFLGTWPHGALTVRSSSARLVVETFVTRQRHVVEGE